MNYIKLNNNQNHLSLGNFFNILKKYSKSKYNAIQAELFCTLFNIDSISDTTVNNYCTGCRSINSEYKQIYINYQKKYRKDKLSMLPIINNLISLIDGELYNYTYQDININHSLINITNDLHILLKNDLYIPNQFKNNILSLINNNYYYEALIEMIFYIILEKKQPIYKEELVTSTIEDILKKTNLSVNDLQKYLSIEFKEGISYVPSLKKLAKENNPYALHKLGIFEYRGWISNKPNYEAAYQYFKEASTHEHPSSYWMLSYMILNKKIGSLSNDDISLMWTYLNKAISLGSIGAINTMGICYLKGINPQKEKNIDLATKYFKEAANSNYIFAFNNLGKIYEDNHKYKEAFEYYEKASTYEESWACNKIAEYYRQGIYVKKDLTKAFEYYTISNNSESFSKIPWSNYNLAKYFYLTGNSELGISKDINKAISLLEEISTLKEAQELLLYTYYELYLNTNNQDYLNKINYYLSLLSINIDNKEKIKIENKLKEVKDNILILP